MAGCSRTIATALLAVASSGCVTGHLLEAGRRWERADAFEEASLDGERLVVRYVAHVSDDVGTPLGERRRRAVVALEPLRAARVAAEDVQVELVPDIGPLPGRIVPIGRTAPEEPGAPAALVVRDASQALARIPANAFTTTSTAAWVYPLVPLAVCVDATSLPVLLFFAPGAMVIGD